MTKEQMESRLASLRNEMEEAKAGVYRVQGAIILLEQLITAQDVPPPTQAESPAPTE